MEKPGQWTKSTSINTKQQCREIIYRVYRYFCKEAFKFKKIEDGYFNRVLNRVSKTTFVSLKLLNRLLNEREADREQSGSIRKKRVFNRFNYIIDESYYEYIKSVTYENYLKTNDGLCNANNLKNKMAKISLEYKCCYTLFQKVIKDIGLKTVNLSNFRKILVEKQEIKLRRIRYLEEVHNLKANGDNIFYVGETYVRILPKPKRTKASNTKAKPKRITRASKKRAHSKTNAEDSDEEATGRRIIIVHAGNEEGFLPGALLMSECDDSDDKYDEVINQNTFLKWVQTQLIPSLPSKSVLVMEDTLLHNHQPIEAPHSYSSRSEMIAWLRYFNIPFDEDFLKPELYEIIQQKKDSIQHYTLDVMLAEFGHRALRYPIYHKTLNPIETIFGSIKDYVQEKGKASEAVVSEKIASIKPSQWKKVCNEVSKLEYEYQHLTRLFDDVTDKYVLYYVESDNEISEQEKFDTESSDSD